MYTQENNKIAIYDITSLYKRSASEGSQQAVMRWQTPQIPWETTFQFQPSPQGSFQRMISLDSNNHQCSEVSKYQSGMKAVRIWKGLSVGIPEGRAAIKDGRAFSTEEWQKKAKRAALEAWEPLVQIQTTTNHLGGPEQVTSLCLHRQRGREDSNAVLVMPLNLMRLSWANLSPYVHTLSKTSSPNPVRTRTMGRRVVGVVGVERAGFIRIHRFCLFWRQSALPSNILKAYNDMKFSTNII